MNSLIECWQMLFHGVYYVATTYWWVAATYGAVYAVSAAVFLITLRIKSEDGSLVVKQDSLPYLIAHPLYRHIKANHSDRLEYVYKSQGSICKFFIRLFHMLLLIWPFLVLYFIAVLTIGNILALFSAGEYVVVDLTEDGFFRREEIYIGRRRLVPLIVPTLILSVLGLLIFAFGTLIKLLSTIGFALLCISPLLIIVAAISAAIIYVYLIDEDSPPTAFAAKEFLVSKKEKFCKIVKFN